MTAVDRGFHEFIALSASLMILKLLSCRRGGNTARIGGHRLAYGIVSFFFAVKLFGLEFPELPELRTLWPALAAPGVLRALAAVRRSRRKTLPPRLASRTV